MNQLSGNEPLLPPLCTCPVAAVGPPLLVEIVGTIRKQIRSYAVIVLVLVVAHRRPVAAIVEDAIVMVAGARRLALPLLLAVHDLADVVVVEKMHRLQMMFPWLPCFMMFPVRCPESMMEEYSPLWSYIPPG